jgi:hypothetical protein
MSNVILIVADNPDNYNLTVDNSGESVDCTYTDAIIPSNHAITHRYNGSDPLTIGDIIALPNDPSLFLNGTGGFSSVSGSSSGGGADNLNDLTDVTILTSNSTAFLVRNSGSNIWQDRTASQARVDLGLGTAALSNSGDFAVSLHASRHVTGGIDKIRDASSSQDGLMTIAYASKLDGIAPNANNYILPTPTATTLGGVKRNTGASGEFIQSIDTSGNLVYAVVPNGITNLTISYSSTGVAINSDTGTDVIINAATSSLAGSFSAADKTKLNGIQDGAEVNINVDWNVTTGDAAILNKPTLGSSAALNTGNSSNTVALGNDPRFTDSRVPLSHASSHVSGGSDSIRLATASQDGLMSPAYANKLDGVAVGANNYVLPVATTGVIGGVKRNVGQSGEFIQSIDSSGNLVYATPSGAGSSGVSSVNLSSSYSSTGIVIGNSAGSGVSLDLATNSNAGLMSSSDRLKFTSIESGAEKNINADWNATTGDSVILNKPDINNITNISNMALVSLFIN